MAFRKFFKEQPQEEPEVFAPAGMQGAEAGPEEPSAPAEVMCPDRTVLGATCRVRGGVAAQESLLIEGEVEGEVACEKVLTLEGLVRGPVTCEACVIAGRLEGGLACRGEARVLPGGRVEGNVEAGSLVLRGYIRGDVKVAGLANLDSAEAHLEGDLDAGRVRVEEGAVLCGQLRVAQPAPAQGGADAGQ